MKARLNRREFLALAALSPAMAGVSCRQPNVPRIPADKVADKVGDRHPNTVRRGKASAPGRFFFTSQGTTALMNADGTGLRYLDFTTRTVTSRVTMVTTGRTFVSATPTVPGIGS